MVSRFNEGLGAVVAFLLVLSVICFAIWALIFWKTPSADLSNATPTPTLAPTLVPTASPTPTVAPTQAPVEPDVSDVPTPTSEPTTAEVREIVVRAFEYAYDPGVIQVNAGETIQIRFENTGTMVHNLVIDDLAISSGNIEPDGSTVFQVKIPVNDKSEYTYYCSQDDHRALGMEGRINVVQP
ncbi:cupredoxin domain-containing protein [candidate division WWE3 bacterium]|uniref:Cupredoxin domain-containing protein n=1 Tax=candidate division WWE3 bacterium TaxID=2053526 RepID=A0A955LLJ4_UNCKA|nr:cupredoxin domain-containing protein [candidate division WWE3 bacterium]